MADPSAYQIQGAMPFGPGGNPYQGGGVGNLGNAYQTSYNSALAQNQSMYSNILSGYQRVMGNQVGAEGAIQQGYGDLYNNVIGGIQGIGASQQQSINDTYAQQSGQAKQSLISRGLGNTTVADSTQRGLMLDKQKANVALANQIAQTQAGYQSQLGLAGLGYGNMANMQNTGQGNQQLGWMNTVQAQYPNAGVYNQLAQMSGQAQQANADRALIQKQGQQGSATAGKGYVGAGARNSGGSSLPMGLYSHGGGGDNSFMAGGGGSYIAAGEIPAGQEYQLQQTQPDNSWLTQDEFDRRTAPENYDISGYAGMPDMGQAEDYNFSGEGY